MDDTESTTLAPDTGAPAVGAGTPTIAPEPVSLRDTISNVVKDQNADADKAEAGDEPEADEKPVVKDEKPTEKPLQEKAEPEQKAEPKPETEEKEQPKGREAPQNFLPKAKDVWRNVPNEVKSEVHRVLKEHDEQIAQFKQTGERYEQLRGFDDLARSNGRDLTESLRQMNEIENVMQQNPIAGLNRILMEIGPRKADGQPVSLYELANHVVQQGQEGYQRAVQVQPQQPDNSQFETLRAENESMKMQMAAQPIIAQFAAANPRYYELQDDIALFLTSGKIPPSLSAPERLEAAYDMAVRINPASASSPQDESAPAMRTVSDLGGTKSVKTAPGSISPDMEPERGGSIREVLEDVIKRRKVA